ncbi:unnamed protein product [Polarella glacialis]|uniref:Uncharacterized protein n=1 Tax=Polarella glacialis TaxID=89957 RepID=A0A813J717_POLGL|nr:unnamed protein product [Polarella glacialis]
MPPDSTRFLLHVYGWDFAPANGEQLQLLHKDRVLTAGDDGALLSNMLSDTTIWTGDAVTYVGTERSLSGKMLTHGISGKVREVNGDWCFACFENLGSTKVPFDELQLIP